MPPIPMNRMHRAISIRSRFGCSLRDALNGLEYGNDDEPTAIAYIKALNLAVATPKMTFDERVQYFKNVGDSNG